MEFLLRLVSRAIKKLPFVETVVRYLKNKLISLFGPHAAYYCQVLSEGAQDNIVVSSDLSVVCNCNDMDGRSIIGDLRIQSFDQILSGPIAKSFRKKLAKGKFPVSNCSFCCALRKVEGKKEASRYIKRQALPKIVHVENTVLCNLSCAVCDRETARKRRGNTMSMSDMELVSSRIKEAGIEQIWFFAHGEPFLSPRVVEEIRLLRREHPDKLIVTSTNGLLLNSDEKREAALLLDEIWFSIDGSTEESVLAYQHGSNLEKAIASMKAFVDYRNRREKRKPEVEWRYIVFNWNDSEELVTKAIELAAFVGVDYLRFYKAIYPFHGVSQLYDTAAHFTELDLGLGHCKRIFVREVAFRNKEDVKNSAF